jgi:hypothetical protein
MTTQKTTSRERVTQALRLEQPHEQPWQELGTISAGRMPEQLDLCVFQLSGVDDEHSTAMLDLRASGQEQSYPNIGATTTE